MRAAELSTGQEDDSSGWSSIIGIVTAIIGNVLISFALNTQRYAHVRLEREQAKEEEAYNLNRRQTTAFSDYGALQTRIAEDRGRQNAQTPLRPNAESQNSDNDQRASNEADMLLPSLPAKDGHRPKHDDSSTGADEPSVRRKSYLQSPYWWIGIVVMTIGEAGNFLAYGFAPASIVSPLGVVALISNCMIAPIMLHELFRWRDFVGVLIAVGGAVTVVFSAQGSNPKLGPDSIWELIQKTEFLAYLGITFACMLILMVASNRIGEKTIAIDLGLVGLFGGYTALSTKGVASLLSFTLWRALTYPITYLLVAVLVTTAIMQIKYVNRALQRFDSTRVIPTQFVAFTISVIIGSAVLYRDFESTTTIKAIQFVAGCALTFLGVWCLTSGRNDDENSAYLNKQDEEHAHHIDLIDDDIDSGDDTVTPDQRSDAGDPSTAPSTPKSSSSRPSYTPSTTKSFVSAASHFSSNLSTPTPRSRLHATSSSPLIPQTSTKSSSSHVTQSLSQTPPPANSQNHQNGLQPSDLQPNARYSQPSSHTPFTSVTGTSLSGRSSLTTAVLPGPLTSPLSSGLSVVVAEQRGRLQRGDSVKRGDGIRRKSNPVGGMSTPGGGSKRASVQALGEHEDLGLGTGSQVLERPRVERGATVEVTSRLPEYGEHQGN